MRLLNAHDLTIGYQKPILDNLKLEIHAGDFVGLLGANGSGKSTLVKTLLGIIPALKGHSHLEIEAGQVAYVPQRMKINASIPLTCEEFLELKLNKKITTDEIAKALEWVDLAGFQKKSIHELSGGQLQRLFLAYAIISKPKILFLDEATEGMDVQAMSRFFDRLKKYVEDEQAALIFVSHDLSAVSDHCNRVLCLHQQDIVFDGDPRSPEFHTCLHSIYGEKSFIHEHRH
ncbi:MAG: metal ABC transporter ATP-binding protein [Bdellovibrionales bacterium]|nr:metal ABC transporter ATP-binding protein [Bdellovibrionales bacterium]